MLFSDQACAVRQEPNLELHPVNAYENERKKLPIVINQETTMISAIT
jgi:hypothetical protein